MKIAIINYTFNKTAKTVTFNDYTSIVKECILGILNTTVGKVIYEVDIPSLLGTVSGNVLTLNYDTSEMSDTDKLLIYYDDTAAFVGKTVSSSFTITRPANTTAYPAGSVITQSTPLNMNFTLGRVKGGSGEIVKVLLATNQVTNNSGYKILWYRSNITPLADGALSTYLYANNDDFIGTTLLNSVAGEGGTNTGVFAINDYNRLPFICASNNQDIYGRLVTIDGFTPASGQLFFTKVWANID